MAHITEFSVSGLCGRTDVISHRLNRDVNIFFGLNGTGKTSLLKILYSAMSYDVGILENIPFISAEVKIYSVAYKTVFTLKIAKSEIKKDNSQYYDIELEKVTRYISKETQKNWSCTPKEVGGKQVSGGWRHRFLPTSRLYYSKHFGYTGESNDRPFTEDEYNLEFANQINSLWNSYSSVIFSSIREAQEMGLANILKYVLSPGTGGKAKKGNKVVVDKEKAYELVSKFMERQKNSKNLISSNHVNFLKEYGKNEQLTKIVEFVIQVENKIETTTAPINKLRDLLRKMFGSNKTIQINDEIKVQTNDNVKIDLQNLSSGEKHLIRIFVEVLLAESSTIIIDEPELSMHIDWQHYLIEAMRILNPDSQLIIATHSPEIMAKQSDDKIIGL